MRDVSAETEDCEKFFKIFEIHQFCVFVTLVSGISDKELTNVWIMLLGNYFDPIVI